VAAEGDRAHENGDAEPDHEQGQGTGEQLVPLPVMVPSFWVASTKPEVALDRG
jgi:hypothetical protein